MVRLDVITMEDPCDGALEMLKAYAAVSDDGQDCILRMALKRAFVMVQRYADIALLPGKYCVKAEDHGGEVRVYMGGQAVRVRDGKGSPVAYEQVGDVVHVATEGYVEVEFITSANAVEYDRLMPVVLRYATAVYDGALAPELNGILKECL
jgi:hypothetical protein